MKELCRADWDFVLYDSGTELLLTVLCGSIGIYEANHTLSESEKKQYVSEGVSFIKKLSQEIRLRKK